MTTDNQPEKKPANQPPIYRLILACGNTLRGDDGIGWQIAAALEQDVSNADAHIVVTRQLLPEHAELISRAEVVVFIDCSAHAEAGQVQSIPIVPAEQLPRILTHHLDPASLLRLALDLYEKVPSHAIAITVGGDFFELSEELSAPVKAAIPDAVLAVQQALR